MIDWTPPPGTEGLIFDCDGTLADTMPLHFKAWGHMLARHGMTMSEAKFYGFGGMPTSKIIRLLSDESGIEVPDVTALLHEKENMFLAMLHEVRPVVNVHRIAESHRGKLPMAVASGGYRRIVEQTLHRIGVHAWLNAIVCAEDTTLHKPEPDCFIEAAARMKVKPEKCVAFEDTDIGLEAIRRAGMHAVDIRPWLPEGHGGRVSP
jgi:beta-phosphoglucomutase-like phosphatase (HAD superfamily)